MLFLLFISDLLRPSHSPMSHTTQSLSDDDEFPCLQEDVHCAHNHYSQYFRDELVFFYFHLTRNQDSRHYDTLYQRLQNVLSLFRHLQQQGVDSCYHGTFTQFYKLIAHTRDYFLGKGEHQASYFLLWGWYDLYPDLVQHAITHFVRDIDENTAGYGSWRDIKYLCEFLKIHSPQGETHPLVDFSISLMNNQLIQDVHTWKYSTNAYNPDALSHAAKWVPRENKRFDWLFRRMAVHWTQTHSPYVLKTAKIHTDSYNKALLKCYRTYRKQTASLNKAIQTIEIKQCSRAFQDIVPTSIPKFSLARQRSFFLLSDKPEPDPSKQRAYSTVRSHYYDTHDRYVPPPSDDDMNTFDHSDTPANLNAFYACYSPGYFVKEAYALLTSSVSDTQSLQHHQQYLNQLWEKHTSIVPTFHLSGFLPMVDISAKMRLHNQDPLYHAVGMAIAVAFHQTGEYSKRLLLVDTVPTWVSLAGCDNFLSCVETVFHTIGRSPSTTSNLLHAFSFFSSPSFQTCYQHYEPSAYMKCLVFSSNPEIPCMKQLHSLFSSQQLVLPSFLFWNVYSDFSNDISDLLHDKGTLFLSGSSFYLLRALQYICQDSTSQTLISSILNQSRLQPMELQCVARL